jgi:hypothetical protein
MTYIHRSTYDTTNFTDNDGRPYKIKIHVGPIFKQFSGKYKLQIEIKCHDNLELDLPV